MGMPSCPSTSLERCPGKKGSPWKHNSAICPDQRSSDTNRAWHSTRELQGQVEASGRVFRSQVPEGAEGGGTGTAAGTSGEDEAAGGGDGNPIPLGTPEEGGRPGGDGGGEGDGGDPDPGSPAGGSGTVGGGVGEPPLPPLPLPRTLWIVADGFSKSTITSSGQMYSVVLAALSTARARSQNFHNCGSGTYHTYRPTLLLGKLSSRYLTSFHLAAVRSNDHSRLTG